MPFELTMLALAIVLGVLQLLAAAMAATSQRGLAWNASARDGHPKPLTGVAGRLQRAWSNFQETFPFFAAAVLAVVIAGRQGAHSELGVQLYLGARLLYVPLYALGVPYLRSLVWAVSMAGIALLVWQLLRF